MSETGSGSIRNRKHPVVDANVKLAGQRENLEQVYESFIYNHQKYFSVTGSKMPPKPAAIFYFSWKVLCPAIPLTSHSCPWLLLDLYRFRALDTLLVNKNIWMKTKVLQRYMSKMFVRSPICSIRTFVWCENLRELEQLGLNSWRGISSRTNANFFLH